MPTVNTRLVYSSSPLLPSFKDDNALYITDSNTTALLQQSKNFSPAMPHIELEAGEKHKTLQSIEKILKKAMECGINREGKFVGVGGGVVLDITGFASSIYMRGIEAIYVPTTLLAMVDASIGGKTGVDFNEVKNIVGTFYLPKEVYICSDYLSSLSEVQYKSGLAEMLKIALINRPTLYHAIAQHSEKIKKTLGLQNITETVSPFFNSSMSMTMPSFIELIKDAIEGKCEIVKNDFGEKNERVNLNLGHTFAHALEAALGFSGITHGEAVAWGIARALSLGVLLGKTDGAYRDEVVSLLASLGYSTEPIPQNLQKNLEEKAIYRKNIDAAEMNAKSLQANGLARPVLSSNCTKAPEALYATGNKIQDEIKNAIAGLLLEKMKRDKKNKNNKIRLVLQKKLGCTFTEEVDERYIREVLL